MGEGICVLTADNDHNYILAINPGAVSTKLALFEGPDKIWSEQIYHPQEDLKKFERVVHEVDYRFEVISNRLKEISVSPADMAAIVGRGGMIKPVRGGTYEVNDLLLKHLREGYQGEHASNLGGLLAHRIGDPHAIPSFIVDPVAVDEMQDEARFSGLHGINRRSLAHTLNIKAVCREIMGDDYHNSKIVAVHLGSGISVTAHDNGRMVDVNNAVEEGPFGTERSGGLPVLQFVEWVNEKINSGLDVKDIQRILTSAAGLYSYQKTKSVIEIEEKIENGDEYAKQCLKALAYQISKEIGAMCAVLNGEVDRIIITGGMANSDRLVRWIEQRVETFAQISTIPGEKEMEALALGALRVLEGQEESKVYA